MHLFVNRKQAASVFRIQGDDENALTGALAQCIAYSENLLRAVLRNVGIKNLRKHRIQSARIFYQRHAKNRTEGITDIEIEIPGMLHVIIEAKIKAGAPTLRQCQKYLKRFNPGVPQKRLAPLVDASDVGIIDEYRFRDTSFENLLEPLLWASIYDEAQRILRRSRNDVEKYLLSEFCSFVEGEYYMKSFEEEVWVVPLSTAPLWQEGLSRYHIPLRHQIYFHPAKRTRRKAIYFAPRAFGRVAHVQRILKIEYNKEPKQYIPELSRFSWSSQPYTIFHLGEPVKLPKPVRSGKIWDRLVYCDFDLLVNAQTIDEAHKQTMARRKRETSVRNQPHKG